MWLTTGSSTVVSRSVRRVVPVALLAEKDLLAALCDQAKRWFGHAMHRLGWCGDAVEIQPFQRLSPPIAWDGARDPARPALRDWPARAGPRQRPARD